MVFATASLGMRKEYLLLAVLWLQTMPFMFAMEGAQSDNSYQDGQIPLAAATIDDSSQRKIDIQADDRREENVGSPNPEKNIPSADSPFDRSRTNPPQLMQQDTEDFVDSVTNNHDPSDVGTYDSWTEMQTADGTFCNLTEDDTGPSATGGGILGNDEEGSTPILLGKNKKGGSKFTLAVGVSAQNISVYGKRSTGAQAPYTFKGLIYNDSNGAPNALLGVSSEAAVPSSAAWTAMDFTPGIQLAPGDYWLVIIPATKVDMYYDLGGSNQGVELADVYSDGPSDPFDDNGDVTPNPTYTNANFSIFIEYDYLPTNYEVDREFSFTGNDYDEQHEYLCLKVGTLGAENLEIDVWNDSKWNTLATLTDAYQDSWLNISVGAYLTTDTINFSFHGTFETFDSIVNDTWQFDAILLHTWFTDPFSTEIASSSVANTTTVVLQYQDTYQWWLVWNDTDGNDLIEDLSPPYTLDTEHVNLVETPSLGNHSFQFNATDIGSFPVTITLDRVGYVSQHFILTFNVEERSTTISTPSILSGSTQPVPYGANFSFYFTWQDVGEDVPIPGGAVNINESAVTQESAISGNYSFQFAAQTLGIHGVNITISKTGYKPISYLLTFSIIRSSTLIASATFPDDSTVWMYYGDSYEFWVRWFDDTTSAFIDDDLPLMTGSGWQLVEYVGGIPGTGNHTFRLHGLELGLFQVILTFENPFYGPAIFTVWLEVRALPTQTNGLLANESTSIMVYNDVKPVWITWEDTNHSVGIEISDPQAVVTSPLTITYNASMSNPAGGNFSFVVVADRVGQLSAQFELTKTGYSSLIFILHFIVRARPTEAPNETTGFEIDITVGTTLDGQYCWEDNESQPVTGASVIQFWNGSNIGNISIVEIASGIYDITLGTSGVSQGEYNLTLAFLRYGYENRSISLKINIRGHLTGLELIEIPDVLFRGREFVIAAFLYRNLSQVTFNVMDRLLQEEEAGTEPLDDQELTAILAVVFDDGTEGLIDDTETTNASGIAEFVFAGDFTKSIKNLTGISVVYSGSDTLANTEVNISGEVVPPVRSIEQTPSLAEELIDFIEQNLLFIILSLIILSLLSIISGSRVVAHQKTARRHRALERSLQEIRLLRMVIIRHRDGVRLYSKSVFGVEKDLGEAIAGMSAAIASFMEGISSRAIEGVGEATAATKTEFVRMGQKGMNLLQRNGLYTAVILISEGPLGKFMEENITALQLRVEDQYEKEFKRFFTNEQIPAAELDELARAHLFIGLLGPIQLNDGKIIMQEQLLTAEERRIVRELRAHRELVPMEVLFVDSYIAHLEERGVPKAVAAQFLIKAYKTGMIESVSIEHFRQLQS